MSGYEASFDILRSALYSISFHNQLNKKIDFAPYLLNKLSNHETSFYSEFLSLLLTSHFCVVAAKCVTYVCLTYGTHRYEQHTSFYIVVCCVVGERSTGFVLPVYTHFCTAITSFHHPFKVRKLLDSLHFNQGQPK